MKKLIKTIYKNVSTGKLYCAIYNESNGEYHVFDQDYVSLVYTQKEYEETFAMNDDFEFVSENQMELF